MNSYQKQYLGFSRPRSTQRIRIDKKSSLVFDHSLISKQHDSLKPQGLWYALGDEWIEWCISEMPHWLTNKNMFRIDVNRKHILRLSTVADLRALNAKYSPENIRTRWCAIDWKKVSQDYSGIEITPYQWELRLNTDFNWYYGWDVASGCIWDEKAIRDIVPLDICFKDDFFLDTVEAS